MNLQTLPLAEQYDPLTGRIAGAPMIERRLADLGGCFRDGQAFADALSRGNPVVYSVASVFKPSPFKASCTVSLMTALSCQRLSQADITRYEDDLTQPIKGE